MATDPFLEEKTIHSVLDRSQLELQKTWVVSELFPETIYVTINKHRRAELPVAHFFSRDNKEIHHMGGREGT